MNTRGEGARGEYIARDYLKRQGYEITDINFSCKLGEIDIIAMCSSTLVFVEVKSRNFESYGSGYDAVTKAKMRKIIGAARTYISMRGLHDVNVRFDVVYVCRDECRLVKGAFDLNDAYARGM